MKKYRKVSCLKILTVLVCGLLGFLSVEGRSGVFAAGANFSAVQTASFSGGSGFFPEMMMLSIFDVAWLSSDDPGDEAAEEAEEAAEEAAEKAAEQAAEEAEKAAEEAAEQAAEEAEKAAEEAAEQAAEEAEKAAEEAAEQAAEEAEKAAEEAAEQAAEEAEKAAEEAAEQAAEEAEKAAEEAAEEAAEQAEQASEEAAEKAAREAEKVAEDTAEEAAKQAEEEAEEAAEKAREAEKEAEEHAERKAEEAAEDHSDYEDEYEEARSGSGHEDDDDHQEDYDEDKDEDLHDADRGQHDREEASRSEISVDMVERLREFNEFTDDDGFDAVADEVLILAEKAADLKIDEAQIDQIEQLDGLDMVLVRVRSSGEKKLQDLADEMSGSLKNADSDLNHLFRPGAQKITPENNPVVQVDYSRDFNLGKKDHGTLSVGLIDSRVDRIHPAIKNASVIDRDLVQFDYPRPAAHGTAVASLLVGEDKDSFRGLLPGARLYAVSVFFQTPDGATVATTESLVRALDWLVRQKVRVINMSLSGPPNRLLELALQRVTEKGSIIVAAAGNGGPASGPLYPAAYGGVVAVTAVDGRQKVYLRAVRGSHISFSAPGVDIKVARAGGGYDLQTGTSIAAPFVSAILAEMVSRNGEEWQDGYLEALRKSALDLGAPGFDEIYGHGLIQAVSD